ncbi:MAG: translation elongation factor Ts [Verrucomicrobia bacterium]|nr:translation elongation factor Ts [Kiritimatiellia bacterium]MCP5488227.1 translation elongation factor Ts [Verrucomicrobiota bacterium]
MEITASLVKELRDETNLGMMECKKALQETNGDKEAAIRLLRERGLSLADKRAGRAAKEGRVAMEIYDGGKAGVMIEVNCETDFVAKNENFQSFVDSLVSQAHDAADDELAVVAKDAVVAKIAEIGENIVIRRNVRYTTSGSGAVAGYIHLGGKVGVLVEIACDKDASVQQDAFKDALKDITLHIAACSPQFLSRSEIPAEVVAAEREIYAKQVEGKPENIIEKIVGGKLDKFYSQICLEEQGYVKDPDQTITQFLAATGKTLGDTLKIRRFTRYQVGA